LFERIDCHSPLRTGRYASLPDAAQDANFSTAGLAASSEPHEQVDEQGQDCDEAPFETRCSLLISEPGPAELYQQREDLVPILASRALRTSTAASDIRVFVAGLTTSSSAMHPRQALRTVWARMEVPPAKLLKGKGPDLRLSPDGKEAPDFRYTLENVLAAIIK
jgi:hypothetical protein